MSALQPEWRNWYTHQTQNLASFTAHVGSSPTSGTIKHSRKINQISNSLLPKTGYGPAKPLPALLELNRDLSSVPHFHLCLTEGVGRPLDFDLIDHVVIRERQILA